mgnify:CR=1 FL=1
MITKRYIIAALAFLGLAGNVSADTTKLLEADGWTKITTLPTVSEIANNYYVFVDNSNDLMLGVAKGVNQNTKWYSLGVYYQNSVEPTSADINGKTWTLESYDGGFAMRNLEYSALCFQTEWNANFRWDTNDVQTPNGWAKINLAYLPDGYWTIENAHDAGNYIGPWTAGNFTNGAECAGNKTGDNIGKYQIYTITRAQFKQNLLDNASSSNPVDLTPWYVTNATFDANNSDGWTTSFAANASGWWGSYSFGNLGAENYQQVAEVKQTLTLPNGKYKVALQGASNKVSENQAYVFATHNGSTEKTFFTQSTVNTTDESKWNDMQYNLLLMMQNRSYGQVQTPEVTVTTGSLTIGYKNESGHSWDVYDNFKLYCTGIDLSTYREQYNDFKTKVEGLMTGVSDGETKTTLTNAINTATAAVEAATTRAEILAQISVLRSAVMTFISTTDGLFDITFLASQAYSDWKQKDGSAAGEVTWAVTNRGDWSFAESYESTCATTGIVLYQTVSDLPAGYYQVGMYAMAAYTSGRGFASEATEGDANRSYAFAGNLDDAGSILRTGIPIPFKTSFDFSELTTLDVNVHLSSTGNLTFGVQKDANGSNWHFAQIASIIYSNAPDLTNLIATRDALVAEAEGLLSGSSDYLTTAQQSALQDAIDDGNDANDFDALNTVTLTTLPNAINTAKQQIQLVKDNRVLMIAALERFENDYNLADGTDYRRSTMSAGAWATLITKVNAVSTALDDVSQAANYGTLKDALIAQMDATDGSLRLFKSYKAMSEGVRSLSEGGQVVGGSAADSEMDSDATEQTAITSLNTAFVSYANAQAANFAVPAFLGENLDFSAAEGATLNSDNSNTICEVTGWEVNYADADTWAVLQTHQNDNAEKLYIRKNWGSSATTLTTTKQKMLPVGKYRLSLSWNSNLENMTNLSCYKLGSTTTAIGQATSGAETLTYDFEVTEQPTAFDLVLGFQKQNTGNTPAQLIVDDITLTYQKFDSNNHCDVFAITDGQPVTIAEAFTAATVTNTRTLAQDDDAYTVCLPYALSSNADRQFYELKSSTSETLRFQEVTQTEPLKPYLVIAKNAATLNAENVEVAATTSFDGGAVTAGDFQMKGTLSGISRSEAETLGAYILQSGNKWSQVTSESSASAKIPAYRAYIVATNPGARLLFSSFDDETTGISEAGKQPVRAEFYDLNGRLVGSMPIGKGIYVSGGKKIMKK